jgi:hypothetical protein
METNRVYALGRNMTGSSEFQQICLSARKGGDKPVCITRAEAEHRQQDREAFHSAILLSGEKHEIPWRLKKDFFRASNANTTAIYAIFEFQSCIDCHTTYHTITMHIEN